ncbi:D-alanine--D-alanine ligase family protein [Candidatus Avelusimicrobium sp.]
MTKKIQVAVLYGGKSTEHEVSVHSAQSVCQALVACGKYDVKHIFIDKKGFWFLQQTCREATAEDVAVTPVLDKQGTLWVASTGEFMRPDVFFPVLHGLNGEDGTLQGLLECLDVPYVGCGVLASAMGMDKEVSKIAALQKGVDTLPYYKLSRTQAYDKQALQGWAAETGYPVFVKPVRLGSSVGVSKVKSVHQLHEAVDFAFRFDSDVLVEKGLESPREIFCALLGSAENLQVSECGELKSLQSEFFDYQAKYITAGGCETRVPADIALPVREQIRQASAQVFKALRCSGLARADFLVDKNGKAWFSEINTLPGMSDTSLFPQLFAAAGVAYADILDRLIALAVQTWQEKQTLRLEKDHD